MLSTPPTVPAAAATASAAPAPADPDDPSKEFPHDLSKRPLTKASVSWTVPTDVEAGEDISSPDLSKIVEEVVGRDGWKTGNTMSFIIETEGQWPSPS